MSARKYALGAAVLLIIIALTAPLGSKNMDDVLELDFQAGEPLADMMARSSLNIDVSIPLGMQGLPLPVLADWNGERYRLRLQGGNGKSAVIPWTPSGGTIWMNTGVIDEIDLDFINFDKTRADSPDWTPPLKTSRDMPAPVADTAAAIIELYHLIQSLDPIPVDEVSCYENMPVKDQRPCPETNVLTGQLTDDQIGEAVAELHASYTADLAANPDTLNKPPKRLVLGQWWLPNGNLVHVTIYASVITPDSSVPLSDGKVGFGVTLNVAELFRAGISKLIGTCYDQQALFPDKVIYTPQQAADIFHGLYADFFPPVVDGKTLDDIVELQKLNWTKLTSEYWADPEARTGFCTLLRELEKKAGYTGPFAPFRQEG